MPKALSFGSRGEIVAALKKRRWKDDLTKAHKNKHEDLGLLTAIYTSVGSSTFRSFPKHRQTSPSVVFRSWASTELFGGAFAELRDIQSNVQYREWAFRLAKRLDKKWREQLRYDLDLPRALKLVNLLAKGLCVVSPLWPERCRTVVNYLDVPLDQFSLRPLACIEGHGRLRNASMGSVKTREQYIEIQDTIGELCDEARVPPIAYDFLTWDGAHSHR
jgi:hypothetical protein